MDILEAAYWGGFIKAAAGGLNFDTIARQYGDRASSFNPGQEALLDKYHGQIGAQAATGVPDEGMQNAFHENAMKRLMPEVDRGYQQLMNMHGTPEAGYVSEELQRPWPTDLKAQQESNAAIQAHIAHALQGKPQANYDLPFEHTESPDPVGQEYHAPEEQGLAERMSVMGHEPGGESSEYQPDAYGEEPHGELSQQGGQSHGLDAGTSFASDFMYPPKPPAPQPPYTGGYPRPQVPGGLDSHSSGVASSPIIRTPPAHPATSLRPSSPNPMFAHQPYPGGANNVVAGSFVNKRQPALARGLVNPQAANPHRGLSRQVT